MNTWREGPAMYVPRMDAVVNRWFTTYEDAVESLKAEGGFLFPYRDHFFVTEVAGVIELGLDPGDPDWERIGRDWVRPQDREAWSRLLLQRQIAA